MYGSLISCFFVSLVTAICVMTLMMLVVMAADAVNPLQPTYPPNSQGPAAPPGNPEARGTHARAVFIKAQIILYGDSSKTSCMRQIRCV